MSLESNDTAPTTTTILNVENDNTPPSVDPPTPIFSVTGIQLQQRGAFVPNKMNMLRSPSRESVGTDISLFSVSTLASELTSRMKLLSVKMPGDGTISRGPSPNFDRRRRPENIQEVWFEESNDMIRGMAALSSAVGLSKSFSTSDITDLLTNDDQDNVESGFLPVKRNAISELAISASQHSGYLFEQSVKLDNASRSCSTWVAVGDMPSTSQLPSPHGGAVPSAVLTSNTTSCGPSFTPADLIRSVNKKVRQHYIRRRLMTTYKALERLSQSEFNLDKLEMEAAASTKNSANMQENRNSTAGCSDHSSKPSLTASNRLSVPGVSSAARRQWKNTPIVDTTEERLTINDVERERGQPLSKYDRNMMIFNWLLTLEPDECTVETY